ncbi:ABC transporter ATP-binding protein [Armatimonas sp.]|uniref:ABC transporter ATP-binding protein n=1 Tax=Armatimonas sp. TaxID=1872638 RepID=UPI00286B35EC|nr:ABC transporter ATP-binding protein [Armatimonas sp.]
MAMLEELPASVEAALKAQRNGHGTDPLTLAVKADINTSGVIGERWVTMDADAIRVYSPNGASAAHLDLAVLVSEITGAKTESLVGGGALTVSKGSDVIELARYTTPLGGRMAGVARVMEAIAKGRELPDAELEEVEKLCPKCSRALPKDSDVCRHCFDKRATFTRLLGYAKGYKWQAIVVTVLMLAVTALQLLPGIIVKNLTDDVLVPTTQIAAAVRTDRLIYWVLVMIGAGVLGLVMGIFRSRLTAYLSLTMTRQIRTETYATLQKLGLSYYDKRQSGALLNRVTSDVNELNNFLVDGLQMFVVNGLMLIGTLIIVFRENWKLALLVMIPIPLVVFGTSKIWKFLWGRLEKLWNLRSSMTASIAVALNGTRVVKAFAQEEREMARFNSKVGALYHANLDLENWWATLLPILGFLMTSGGFIVWYVGGKQVIGGEITFGTLNMFFYYLGQLYGPLQGMTRIADWLGRVLTSAERVFEVMDTQPDVADTSDSVAMPNMKGELLFENVSFGYDKARRVLENVDLHVMPGEMIGLVGHSGAGKSTIINLISRFYDPSEGRILIDGVEMKKVKLQDLRSQMGIVLQEPFLFPGTISENIAYGKADATREQIMRAAKAANAHDFILRFPDGYDSLVGERGARLSGGERQRISIARAILHDPKVLILDEATASVDTETEKQIQEAIQRLIAGRTTFAIAHRLSTLRNADRLVVIEKGRVAEMGTHAELMEKDNGIFRKLVEMQLEVNKLKAENIVLED